MTAAGNRLTFDRHDDEQRDRGGQDGTEPQPGDGVGRMRVRSSLIARTRAKAPKGSR
jgi:hypothetical protein